MRMNWNVDLPKICLVRHDAHQMDAHQMDAHQMDAHQMIEECMAVPRSVDIRTRIAMALDGGKPVGGGRETVWGFGGLCGSGSGSAPDADRHPARVGASGRWRRSPDRIAATGSKR